MPELGSSMPSGESYFVIKTKNSKTELKPGSSVVIKGGTALANEIRATIVSVGRPKVINVLTGLPAEDKPHVDSFVFAIKFFDRPPLTEPPMTDKLLGDVILPIIVAMSNMQRVLGGNTPRIAHISQNSPIGITLEGAGELYERIASDVIPWRRKHAKALAELASHQSRAELEKMRAEVLEAEAKTTRERADAEAAKERARQSKMDADIREVELTKARFELAISIVAGVRPNASEVERFQMIAQLVPELTKITDVRPVVNTAVRITKLGSDPLRPK